MLAAVYCIQLQLGRIHRGSLLYQLHPVTMLRGSSASYSLPLEAVIGPADILAAQQGCHFKSCRKKNSSSEEGTLHIKIDLKP